MVLGGSGRHPGRHIPRLDRDQETARPCRLISPSRHGEDSKPRAALNKRSFHQLKSSCSALLGTVRCLKPLQRPPMLTKHHSDPISPHVTRGALMPRPPHFQSVPSPTLTPPTCCAVHLSPNTVLHGCERAVATALEGLPCPLPQEPLFSLGANPGPRKQNDPPTVPPHSTLGGGGGKGRCGGVGGNALAECLLCARHWLPHRPSFAVYNAHLGLGFVREK